MDVTPSKTRSSVPEVTHGIQNTKGRILKPSTAQFLECAHSDVSSESATDSVPWNMQNSAQVGAGFKTDGEELGLLDSSDAVATALGTSAPVGECTLFSDASNDCGGIEDLLIPDIMGGPATLGEDGADVPISLLDGFLQSF